ALYKLKAEFENCITTDISCGNLRPANIMRPSLMPQNTKTLSKTRFQTYLTLTVYMLGVKELTVGMNKRDSTELPYSERRYEEIINEVNTSTKRTGYNLNTIAFVPISPWNGENTLAPMHPATNSSTDKPLHLPLQVVYKFDGIGDIPVGQAETVLKPDMVMFVILMWLVIAEITHQWKQLTSQVRGKHCCMCRMLDYHTNHTACKFVELFLVITVPDKPVYEGFSDYPPLFLCIRLTVALGNIKVMDKKAAGAASLPRTLRKLNEYYCQPLPPQS
ncbi:Elongation factor 1-alpha 2, partial [Galemys pyrenaicus]